MKDRDESYLDNLLESISKNSDNPYDTMLDNDADSFQLDDDTFEDLDLDDLDDDFSFDLDDDFEEFNDYPDFKETKQMNQKDELQQKSVIDNKVQEPVIESTDIEDSMLEELEPEPISQPEPEEVEEIPMSMKEEIDPEESVFDDNLMETFLGESSLESEPSEEPEEEEFNPMGDVEDLLGMLAQEEESEDDLMHSFESGEDSLMPEPEEEDVFSLDGILEQDVPSTMELEESDKENKKDKKKNKKNKKSLFQKLFGNVHDEKAKAKKSNVPLDEDGNPISKPKKTKEAIKAEKLEKKKKQEETKKEAETKKSNVKSQKDAQKQEKALKKEEKKKAKQAEAVVEADEGRINRLGATIVFLFFGVVAMCVVMGTDNFSYSQSVKKATTYFGMQKYNNAYDEVRGIDVKEKDNEIYDKIMTVMFVNKQLNSYNNYYNMDMYPEALDSLLKGLQRYDEYLSLAKELRIKSDLDYVRSQILGELNSIFSLSEDDSYHIIKSESQEIYSEKVMKAASYE